MYDPDDIFAPKNETWVECVNCGCQFDIDDEEVCPECGEEDYFLLPDNEVPEPDWDSYRDLFGERT